MAKLFPRRDEKGRIKENIYMTILYPDAQNYDFEQNLIWIKNNAIQYCIAKHYKDINEQGEYINKPHAHIYFQFANPRVLDCIKDALNLNDDAEIKAVNLKKIGGTPSGIIRYYAHVTKEAKEHNKIEYDFHEFETNMEIEKYFISQEKITADDKVKMIKDYIMSQDYTITYRSLIDWACENNCFSELRRGSWLFQGLIREHNYEIEPKHIATQYKKLQKPLKEHKVTYARVHKDGKNIGIDGTRFVRDDTMQF